MSANVLPFFGAWGRLILRIRIYMFEIEDNKDSRVYILYSDEILNNLKLFEESVERFIKTDDRDLVLDMTNLSSLNSMFLAFLIRIKTSLFVERRIIRLVNYNESVYRSLEVAGLDSYFHFE